MTLLSKPAILREMEAGNIFISPFDPENVGTNSYDVTLGKYYWKSSDPSWPPVVYNMYDANHIENFWTLAEAAPLKSVSIKPERYVGIAPEDKVIMLRPGESILAHTQEFIGSSGPNITTKMFARSSTGRSFLHVCACAGLGDVGFMSRWTMEIFNRSTLFTIPLVVGRRYAQISFFDVEPIEEGGRYFRGGKYQQGATAKEVMKAWKPEAMLPKAYLDREVPR